VPQQDLDRVRTALAELTVIKGWASMQTPRNMALALTARVGAVAGHLQFAAEQAAPEPADPELAGEIADCLVYLVALADSLQVDGIAESKTAAADPDGQQTVGT
jgi:NTP pyrophosphatase (non-canonical NTP hydrolase)